MQDVKFRLIVRFENPVTAEIITKIDERLVLEFEGPGTYLSELDEGVMQIWCDIDARASSFLDTQVLVNELHSLSDEITAVVLFDMENAIQGNISVTKSEKTNLVAARDILRDYICYVTENLEASFDDLQKQWL